MKKRIYLRGPEVGGVETVEFVEVEENLIRYDNDGVSTLRVRAGAVDRWFPNWRVLEVADAPPEDGEPLALTPFAPVTAAELGYDAEATEAAVPGYVEHGVLTARQLSGLEAHSPGADS